MRHEGDRCVGVSEAVPLATQPFPTWVTPRPPSPHPGCPPKPVFTKEGSLFLRPPTSGITALPHQRGLPCPSVHHRMPCHGCSLLSVSPSLCGTESWVSRSHGTQPPAHGGCSTARLEGGLSDGLVQPIL